MTVEDDQKQPMEMRFEENVAIITLTNPDQRNPLSQLVLEQLQKALNIIRSTTKIRALVLTGTGKSFCAGGDLNGLDDIKPVLLKRFMADSQAVIRNISSLPIPVVVAINGAAAGAGFSLAVSGDILIADEHAKFIPAFSLLGAVPDLGLAHTLHRTLGLHRTSNILLRNEKIDATEAHSMGLVSEVVSSKNLMQRAMEIAEQLSHGPTVALGLTKALIRTSATSSLASFMEAESSAQALAFASEDFAEGISAIREKRSTSFSGK